MTEYILIMIKNFSDAATKELFETGKSRKLHIEIHASGLRALQALNGAATLADLRGTGRQLEALRGKKNEEVTYTIRVNAKYRVLFHWRDGHAHDVRIDNPHKG